MTDRETHGNRGSDEQDFDHAMQTRLQTHVRSSGAAVAEGFEEEFDHGGRLARRTVFRKDRKLHELLITAQVVSCRSGDYLHCEANGDEQFGDGRIGPLGDTG